jgi:hypothetical protein
MTELPEPDGEIEVDCGPYPDGLGRLVEYVDGYTADTVRKLIAQSRDSALEEAAKVCDQWNATPGSRLATEIRSLKEKQA